LIRCSRRRSNLLDLNGRGSLDRSNLLDLNGRGGSNLLGRSINRNHDSLLYNSRNRITMVRHVIYLTIIKFS
jgi:hypothetical protein